MEWINFSAPKRDFNKLRFNKTFVGLDGISPKEKILYEVLNVSK
jgi:hypothetical protein